MVVCCFFRLLPTRHHLAHHTGKVPSPGEWFLRLDLPDCSRIVHFVQWVELHFEPQHLTGSEDGRFLVVCPPVEASKMCDFGQLFFCVRLRVVWIKMGWAFPSQSGWSGSPTSTVRGRFSFDWWRRCHCGVVRLRHFACYSPMRALWRALFIATVRKLARARFPWRLLFRYSEDARLSGSVRRMWFSTSNSAFL